jgi:hypothetical protein
VIDRLIPPEADTPVADRGVMVVVVVGLDAPLFGG